MIFVYPIFGSVITNIKKLFTGFQEKFYLWGVFRGKQAAESQSRNSNAGGRTIDQANNEANAVERKPKKSKTTDSGGPVSSLSNCRSGVCCS